MMLIWIIIEKDDVALDSSRLVLQFSKLEHKQLNIG